MSKTKVDWKKVIEERNAKFQKLSDKKKRIALAEDVLAMIKAKRIRPETGVYFELDDDNDYSDEAEVAEYTVGGEAECRVCALGSLLVSHINKTDACTVEWATNTHNERIAARLSFFTRDQLALIECAFECTTRYRVGADFEACYKAAEFGENFDDDEDRLKAIMENIVANKGTFVP